MGKPERVPCRSDGYLTDLILEGSELAKTDLTWEDEPTLLISIFPVPWEYWEGLGSLGHPGAICRIRLFNTAMAHCPQELSPLLLYTALLLHPGKESYLRTEDYSYMCSLEGMFHTQV